ncbi:hypothetical protein P9139_06635 [Curtobacterium flaccumfaciens]|nr:hypothetical protein P9139_06635 [Curtobacterium flaccumfaciens]
MQYEGDGISFRRGDVLFGKLRPNLRKAWLADTDGDAVGDFHVYRPVPSLMTSRYLAYVALSEPFLEPVIASVYGAKMPRADWGEIRNIKVWVPDPLEQRAIADYLDRETTQIDAFIAKNEELITLLIERRLSATTAAVTQAANGPLVALRNVALVLDCKHVTAESADGDGSFAVASVREVAGHWVNVTNARRTTEESFRSLGEGGRTLEPWDLLVCRNTSVGKVSIVPPDIEPTVMGQDVSLIRTRPADRDASRFLHYVLTSAVGSDAFERASIGSTFKRINVDDIKSLRVPQVEPKTARRVADELDALTSRIDKAISTAERGVRLARERRAALISAAVTGKTNVGVAA